MRWGSDIDGADSRFGWGRAAWQSLKILFPIRGLWRLAYLAVIPVVSVAQTQNISIAAVTDSVAFQPGLPQKGSPASIFVTGLEGSPGIIAATEYPLPKVLDGINVWINSVPAPIFAIAFENGYQQINVQVPWEVQGDPTNVAVFQNGIEAQVEVAYTGTTFTSPLSVFFADVNGFGIVQHVSDYSLVTPQNPAHAGEYLVAYGINLGPVSNTPASGTPPPFNPLAIVTPVFPLCAIDDTISWGGPDSGASAQSPALFVGLTPGTVGVYQVNFQVPASLPAGNLSIGFGRVLSETEYTSCPGPGSSTILLTQQSRTVLLPVQ
jgi:uncharacterized protein (TIGR03437 family)